MFIFVIQISLDLNVSDKFCSLLKVALEVLAQLLEISSLFDIGKYAEEFLTYLKSTFAMEATATVLCVQQVSYKASRSCFNVSCII